MGFVSEILHPHLVALIKNRRRGLRKSTLCDHVDVGVLKIDSRPERESERESEGV